MKKSIAALCLVINIATYAGDETPKISGQAASATAAEKEVIRKFLEGFGQKQKTCAASVPFIIHTAYLGIISDNLEELVESDDFGIIDQIWSKEQGRIEAE